MDGWEFMWVCVIVFIVPPTLSAIISGAMTVMFGTFFFEGEETAFFWGGFVSLELLLFVIMCGVVFFE